MNYRTRIVYVFFLLHIQPLISPSTTSDTSFALTPLSPSFSFSSTPFSGKEKKIKLRTRDGIQFTALVTFVPRPKGNIILCHPASKDKEFMEPYAKQLFREYNTIRFDFRFHGEHKNKRNHVITIGKKEAYEIQAAAHFFKRHKLTRPLPLYGFGISMGAAALLSAEFRKPIFNGLIIQSCFENLRDQIKRMFPWVHPLVTCPLMTLIARKLCHIDIRSFKPYKMIEQIKTPIFLIHAHNDHFIPLTAFHKLKDSGKSVVKIWTPENGRHTQIFETAPEEYAQQCRDFFLTLDEKKIPQLVTT